VPTRQERRERRAIKVQSYKVSIQGHIEGLEPKTDEEFGKYAAEVTVLKCKDLPQEADLIRSAVISIVNAHNRQATAWYFQHYNELMDRAEEKETKKRNRNGNY